MAKTQIVCPHCGSINRVPEDKPARAAKCGRCHNDLFTGTPVALTGASFDRHIRHNSIPVLVDFWAAWCRPCKMMAPVLEQAARELEPSVRFLKLNTEAAPEIAARYNVRSIPTLILFRDGAIVAQRAGAVDGRTLRAWLEQLVRIQAAAS